MAQHDYVIGNQTAPNFRADLNNALSAAVTNNSGPSAPSTTYANMLWYDTANNTLKMRTEADDAWIDIGTLNQATNTFEVAGLTALSEATWEAGTSTTEAVVSPAKVKAAIDALVPEASDTLGENQSWSSTSFSSGTSVQNTTGRPIQISITVRSYGTGPSGDKDPNASNVQVSSDNSTWVTLGQTDSSSSGVSRVSVTAIIPNGHYYRYNGVASNMAVLS